MTAPQGPLDPLPPTTRRILVTGASGAGKSTLRRRIHRIELWNGNVEPPLRTVFTDRDHIIRWSWRTHRKRQREALDVAHRGGGPLVVRLTGQHQVDTWVRGPLRQLANRDPAAE